MTSPSAWLARMRAAAQLLIGFAGGKSHDCDLDDELRFHIDKATERNLRRGMSAAEARRAAEITFGGRTRWAEAARDERRSPIIEEFARDVRYGMAMLHRNPGFAASAILTIGLGLAAAVTVFSFINSIYLRPLDVPEGRRIVHILGGDHPDLDVQLGYPAYALLRQSARSFDMVAAHYSTAPLYLTSRGESAEAMGAVVSADYFRMLGIRPALGRYFLPAEDSVPDRDAVAVIGYGLWQRRFGGDTRVLGETVMINNRAFTIVGVAPQDFDGVVPGIVSNLWIPTMMLHTGYRWCDGFQASCAITSIVARLAPGVTLTEARAEMSALAPRLRAVTDPSDSIHAISTVAATGVPVWQQHQFAQLTLLLSAIAIILMGVACANLSGLLLARGLTRHKEIALRTSLGAGRWRIIRQMLTESALIACAGGLVGVLLSLWTSRALVGFFAADDEGYAHRYGVPLDSRVLLFAMIAVFVAVMAFGLFPAFRGSRVDLAESLRGGVGGSVRRGRARMVLVAGQMTLTLTLLIGAGLLTRSFGRMMSVRVFDPRQVVQLRLRPMLLGYAPEKAQRFLHRAMDAIYSVPGVVSAAPVRGSLISQLSGLIGVALPGAAAPSGDLAPRVDYFDIGPRYFATLRVPLVAGREFTDQDGPDSPLVAIVNESLAKRLWPAGGAVGNPVMLGGKEYRVVGVVRDHRVNPMRDAPPAMAYVSFWQNSIEPQVDARVAIRVEGNPSRALLSLQRAVASVDPAVPVTEVLAMDFQMRATFTEVRLGSAVLMVGATLALVLSAIGLYGVVAFLVTQRAKEIGIRIAVGARPRDVLTLLLRQGMRPVWIGGATGVLVSAIGARFLSRWLFGIAPIDPLTIATAAAAVGIVAVTASYVPARGALRTDPAAVFRCD
jgi:predicted permease